MCDNSILHGLSFESPYLSTVRWCKVAIKKHYNPPYTVWNAGVRQKAMLKMPTLTLLDEILQEIVNQADAWKTFSVSQARCITWRSWAIVVGGARLDVRRRTIMFHKCYMWLRHGDLAVNGSMRTSSRAGSFILATQGRALSNMGKKGELGIVALTALSVAVLSVRAPEDPSVQEFSTARRHCWRQAAVGNSSVLQLLCRPVWCKKNHLERVFHEKNGCGVFSVTHGLMKSYCGLHDTWGLVFNVRSGANCFPRIQKKVCTSFSRVGPCRDNHLPHTPKTASHGEIARHSCVESAIKYLLSTNVRDLPFRCSNLQQMIVYIVNASLTFTVVSLKLLIPCRCMRYLLLSSAGSLPSKQGTKRQLAKRAYPGTSRSLLTADYRPPRHPRRGNNKPHGAITQTSRFIETNKTVHLFLCRRRLISRGCGASRTLHILCKLRREWERPRQRLFAVRVLYPAWRARYDAAHYKHVLPNNRGSLSLSHVLQPARVASNFRAAINRRLNGAFVKARAPKPADLTAPASSDGCCSLERGGPGVRGNSHTRPRGPPTEINTRYTRRAEYEVIHPAGGLVAVDTTVAARREARRDNCGGTARHCSVYISHTLLRFAVTTSYIRHAVRCISYRMKDGIDSVSQLQLLYARRNSAKSLRAGTTTTVPLFGWWVYQMLVSTYREVRCSVSSRCHGGRRPPLIGRRLPRRCCCKALAHSRRDSTSPLRRVIQGTARKASLADVGAPDCKPDFLTVYLKVRGTWCGRSLTRTCPRVSSGGTYLWRVYCGAGRDLANGTGISRGGALPRHVWLEDLSSRRPALRRLAGPCQDHDPRTDIPQLLLVGVADSFGERLGHYSSCAALWPHLIQGYVCYAVRECNDGGKRDIPEKMRRPCGIVRYDSHLRKFGSDTVGGWNPVRIGGKRAFRRRNEKDGVHFHEQDTPTFQLPVSMKFAYRRLSTDELARRWSNLRGRFHIMKSKNHHFTDCKTVQAFGPIVRSGRPTARAKLLGSSPGERGGFPTCGNFLTRVHDWAFPCLTTFVERKETARMPHNYSAQNASSLPGTTKLGFLLLSPKTYASYIHHHMGTTADKFQTFLHDVRYRETIMYSHHVTQRDDPVSQRKNMHTPRLPNERESGAFPDTDQA
ncbi:hypothetical protein PR048_006600 [Dryococelus australis]|uniref:Uncharacterized protein n=1 Tax=Dryococelus australis TaxID=614101 RepID=A0ABQ9IDM7_9NEOP|nr:hypothetical protein PR048_006600 [Dryococelus australis]